MTTVYLSTNHQGQQRFLTLGVMKGVKSAAANFTNIYLTDSPKTPITFKAGQIHVSSRGQLIPSWGTCKGEGQPLCAERISSRGNQETQRRRRLWTPIVTMEGIQLQLKENPGFYLGVSSEGKPVMSTTPAFWLIDDESIRRRAHEIWINEGSPEGRSLEHWHLAQQELITV